MDQEVEFHKKNLVFCMFWQGHRSFLKTLAAPIKTAVSENSKQKIII